MAVVTCGNCGAKNRVDEWAARGNLQPVCGKCGAKLAGHAGGGQTRSAGEGRPLTVTDASFQRDVLGESLRPVLLDCWAEWCGPCRMIAPVLDELAAESRGRYRIAKLNVDANPATASRFNVQSIPTLIVFKDGRPVDRIVGLQPKQALAARIAAQM